MKTRRIAIYGMFLGLALIFSYVEMLLPISIGVPGVKIGLANIITMIVLYYFGFESAIIISVIRILLTGMLFGSAFSMVYSAAGALLSVLVMTVLMKTGKFGMVGISVAGGVFHNVGQIIVAAAVLETAALVYYLPILIIAGLAAGVVVGLISGFVMRRLAPLLRKYMDE